MSPYEQDTDRGVSHPLLGQTVRYPRTIGGGQVFAWSDPVSVYRVITFDHGGAQLRYRPSGPASPDDHILLSAVALALVLVPCPRCTFVGTVDELREHRAGAAHRLTPAQAAGVALLRRDGHLTVTRAAADMRGVALAELCEATEADRDWLPGWDGSRWRVIGTGLIFADGAR